MWKWFSKRVPNSERVTTGNNELVLKISTEHLAFQPVTQIPEWLYQPLEFGIHYETVSFLAQVEEQGYADYDENILYLLWDDYYRLRSECSSEELNSLLLLPREKALRPSLQSQGSLEDAHFRIVFGNWFDEQNVALSEPPEFTGGLAKLGSEEVIVTEPLWRLVSAVKNINNSPVSGRSGLENRRLWASIRRYAQDTGTELSDFLLRTVVLTPERLTLGLHKSDFGGTKTIEVQPTFDGAPNRWLEFFDRFQEVPDRYDIPDGQGMTHVIIDPQVKSVLKEIRRWPARLVSGQRAEAFIRNPFAALGEDATKVLDEDQFEKARSDAGITFQHFTCNIQRNTAGLITGVSLIIQEMGVSVVNSERYDFPDVAQLDRFINKLSGRIESNHQCCVWEGFELEILGDTDAQLEILKKAYKEWSQPQLVIRYSEVYDLSRYSSRIEGIGVEKLYYSPFIAKKNNDAEWIPENVLFGLWHTPEGSEEPVAITLDDSQQIALKEKIEEAKRSGDEIFSFSGLEMPISVRDAENILHILEEAKKDVKKGTYKESKASDDEIKHLSDRKSLLIKPNIESLEFDESKQGRIEALTLPQNSSPILPTFLKTSTQLKEHQCVGIAWLQHLWMNTPEYALGALLADDMGLGKTLQLLCFIASCIEADPNINPILIVAPVSLLENWKEEVEKFFEPGSMPVLMLYGDDLKSKKISKSQIDQQLLQEGIIRFLAPGWLGDAKVVLTTYETLRDLEFSLAAQKWSIMVCDEAQKIKNPNALVTRAAKKQNVRFKIPCTGTPVENSLADLWCLYDFIQPGLLGALNDFGTRYRRPIEAETDEEKERVEELRNLIEPQLLRRTKADVAKDLPKKIIVDNCKELKLSSKQRELYGHAVSLYKQRTDSVDSPFKNHLGLIQYLRQLCTDPRPIGQRSNLEESLEEYSRKAPKMAWLLETLSEIKSRGDKAIVFVEFHDLQRLIQRYIAHRFDIVPDIINGTTSASSKSSDSRQKRIKAFQQKEGFGVIILSPLAVGFGVNIQGANHVIHYTRTWNPAKEDQATDRAYRIGQTKDVFVYYPVVTADFTTFDMKLDNLLEWKRGLSNDMLNGCGDLSSGDFDELGSPDGVGAFTEVLVDESDIATFDGRFFEAFCAALWAKQGYTTYRTPDCGDGGVDVVAIRGTSGFLIQCKSSLNDSATLGWEAIKDVVAGEALYRIKHPKVEFTKVATTNQRFNRTAQSQAEANRVNLIDRHDLVQLLKSYTVTRIDLENFLLGINQDSNFGSQPS
ncbi:SNF2-related protein [Methylicorpusculum oleiharenae]|uniref:SNF2-related protein n=1 Tax=Methylicorpusculum oleiharenae TaxID=1338687 RepID=UPI0013568134|nr:SNF2-related protein [Methylicorpusculum oleiharenae]MCD2453805.1 SNF2-related protein [Methylicorpusculum oleiharenae]